MKVSTKRILMSLCGVIVCAVAVGVFKIAAFGVDPFQSLMSGLDKLIPIEFGTLYVIVNAILLVFSLIANRQAVGVATFLNLFLLGYITQYTYECLQKVLAAPSVITRLVCLAIAIVVISFGSAFYMTANLGVSTYDAVAITIAQKWKLGKFQYVRIITDLICVAGGIICFIAGGGKWSGISAVVGIATIITAFFMGPLINFFNNRFAIPFLNSKNKSEK